MARRKIGAVKRKRKAPVKRATTTRRRRRRISGIGKIDIGGIAMKAAGLGAGAIAARELNTIAVKQFPTITPMISGLIQVGAGVVLPMLVKGNKFVSDMGDGMIANGIMVEAVNMGIISGTDGNSTMSYRINGTGNLKTISGRGNLKTIAGRGNLKTIAGTPRRVNYKRSEKLY